MSNETIFLVEKSMGLFWVLIQQICFCGAGYVYDDLADSGRAAKYAKYRTRWFFTRQAVFFLSLCVVSFERELGISFLSSALYISGRDFYPWAVRIILCSSMILFDALLLLYTWRVYRLCDGKGRRAGGTLPGDLPVVAAAALLCVAYIRASINAALTLNISMPDYTWLGRAFIQLSNFFYVPLEIAGAILLYYFRKSVEFFEENGETGRA